MCVNQLKGRTAGRDCKEHNQQKLTILNTFGSQLDVMEGAVQK